MLDALNNMRTRFVGAGLFIIVLFLASPLHAVRYEQRPPDDSAFYLGARLVGSTLHFDTEPDTSTFFIEDDGGGLQLFLGYRCDTGFSLELALSAAGHETSDPDVTAGIGAVQLFAEYRFARGHWFRPYLKGGIGGYGLGLDDGSTTVTISGGGVAFGGGFDFFIGSHFSLGLDYTHNIIDYEKAEVDFGGTTFGQSIDEEGSMSTLGLSAIVHF